MIWLEGVAILWIMCDRGFIGWDLGSFYRRKLVLATNSQGKELRKISSAMNEACDADRLGFPSVDDHVIVKLPKTILPA